MARTGATLVVDALVAAGVRHLFTLSGNQILSIYDATIGRDLALIHTRHEAAAVHMADAWGRLTERPGVALVTAGPGHCNALSALYGALMAESPLVLLSGASPRSQRGRGAFQEVDQVAAAAPLVKAAWCAQDAERLGEDIATALALAAAGRPGPVHVSLPGDLLEAAVPAEAPAAARALPAPPAVDEAALAEAIARLAQARRPLVLTGPAMGRGGRWAAVQRFSEASGVPALPVESPRGVNDPWLRAAALCFAEADVVLLLDKPLDFSLRFGRPPAFSAACRFIQVSAEPAEPKPERVDLTVTGDPGLVARRLAAAAKAVAWPGPAWRDEVTRARTATPPAWEAHARAATAPMHPLRLCAGLRPLVEAGAVVVCDGGEFGQWAQAALPARERLINGLSGSIGSAIPMALAARLACPDRAVLAVLGDGTFGFHAFELDTALRHGLPVVTVVGNDARWNAEHTLQVAQYGAARAVGCSLLPTRYDQVAAALGGHGELVERPEQLGAALARAVAAGRPACVNVLIDGVAAPTFTAAAH